MLLLLIIGFKLVDVTCESVQRSLLLLPQQNHVDENNAIMTSVNLFDFVKFKWHTIKSTRLQLRSLQFQFSTFFFNSFTK